MSSIRSEGDAAGAVRVAGWRRGHLVLVPASAAGPTGRRQELDLLVDTGTSRTCLSTEAAARLGLDLTRPLARRRLRGIGTATAPIVSLPLLQISTLVARDLPVAVPALPALVPFDGMLGLDFCAALGLTRLLLELDTATLILR